MFHFSLLIYKPSECFVILYLPNGARSGLGVAVWMQMIDMGSGWEWPAGWQTADWKRQQRFAKHQSLFTSFAWVDLGAARRSALQAGRKFGEIHKHLKCIPKSEPSISPLPLWDIARRLISISVGRFAPLCLVYPPKLWQPRMASHQTVMESKRWIATHAPGVKSQDVVFFSQWLFSEKWIRYYLCCPLETKIVWCFKFVFTTCRPLAHGTDTTEDVMECFLASLSFKQ